MQKDLLVQFLELEKAIGKTRQLANGISTRVEGEVARWDAIAVKLTGLQGLLNQAGGIVGEIHIDLEVRS